LHRKSTAGARGVEGVIGMPTRSAVSILDRVELEAMAG
jgi:hypothetical protein